MLHLNVTYKNSHFLNILDQVIIDYHSNPTGCFVNSLMTNWQNLSSPANKFAHTFQGVAIVEQSH